MQTKHNQLARKSYSGKVGFWRALGLIAIDANSICAYGPHFVLGSDDQ